MAATLLVFALMSTAQAAEPTGTLTLTCTGTETYQGGEGTSSEQVSKSIVVDFQKKSVMGLSDGRLAISNVDETTISLSGADAGWVMNGGIDRGTGWLYAVSTKSDPSTRQTILSVSYDLQCKDVP